MTRIRINVGKVGVVRRNGDYDRIIIAGSYRMTRKEEVQVFDMSTLYTPMHDFNIMFQDEKFKEKVEVIDVADNEIALKYTRNNFMEVLTAGRYFFFTGLADFRFEKIDLNEVQSSVNIDKSVMKSVKMQPYRYEFKIESSEEGLLFIDGKYIKRLTKGLYFFLRGVTPVEVLKIDMREIQLEVSGQEMLTKDKAALRINFQANYQVVDAEKALLDNKDFGKQLYTLLQLGLREFVGTLTLDELLEAKETVANSVLEFCAPKAKRLGVEVLSAGIRDIILPGEVKEIMNKVLIAQKSAEASNIQRREETAATRSLLNVAKLMEDNEMLFKLKEMAYIERIAERVGEVTVSNGGKVIDQLTNVFSK